MCFHVAFSFHPSQFLKASFSLSISFPLPFSLTSSLSLFLELIFLLLVAFFMSLFMDHNKKETYISASFIALGELRIFLIFGKEIKQKLKLQIERKRRRLLLFLKWLEAPEFIVLERKKRVWNDNFG